MKTAPRLSGPVLAFGIVGLAIILAISWLGYHRHHTPLAIPETAASEPTIAPPASDTNTPTETVPTAPEPVATDFPDGLPPVIPISLVPHLIDAENSTWLKDEQYKLVPHGTQDFGGIAFQLEGMVQLQGRLSKDWKKRSYRTQVTIPLTLTNVTEGGVEIMQRGSNIGSVYLIGGTRYESETEAVAANLIWRYVDGTSATTPIQFGVHVRDWIREQFEQPARLPYPFTKVVWTTPEAKRPERALRLYRLGLANPWPQKTITRLDFLGMTGDGTLFITALTLDPLRLGQRPDNSPDLEPTDTAAGSWLQLQVVGPEGYAIPKAKVRLEFRRKAGTPTAYATRTLATDENGALAIQFSPENLERFEVGAGHDDYGGRKMAWDLTAGDVMPTAYTLKLGAGVSIGGIVVDEAEQPVANVKLDFYRFWSGDDDSPNKAGNQADFQTKSASTDATGHWRLRGIPKELLDNIGFNLSHPDFVGTNFNVRSSPGDEAKFLDGTHKIVLRRGLIIKGFVLDAEDKPVKDAKVWAGRAHYSGTQETKTDAKGAFSFRGVNEGLQSFSVLAKNLKPVTTNLTVKIGMEDIVFRLSAGLSLSGIVKNEAGEPIPGVRLSLEGEHGGVSQDYDFAMTSDNEGRFEWNGAPEESLKFSILKQGYESKRQQILKVGEENIVTLRKGRKVQAYVVDAETGKPITKFRGGVGRSHNYGGDGESFYAEWPGMKDYTDVNGMFTAEITEEQVNGIKAEADDYSAKVEQLPTAENGVVQVTLRLKASPSIRGVLVNSQGQPVPGATVALTRENSFGGQLRLLKGKLGTYGNGEKIAITDAEGKFTLGSPPETGGMVIAAAESGFARATAEEVRNSGRLVLQDFGRIEGTIKVAGSPSAGHEFLFSLMNIGLQSDWQTSRTISDSDGKFVFEKVPPGEGQVVRLIKSSPNSWMHSHQTTVNIEPGKTAHVSFGEEGAVIKGQVRLEVPPGEGESLSFNGSLNTRTEFNRSFATPEEATAFYKSDAWKEERKRMKYYAVAVGADGSFSLDSIPPGEYNLNVTATKPKPGSDSWNTIPVASGNTTITVPENASPYAPIGISDLILKPVKK